MSQSQKKKQKKRPSSAVPTSLSQRVAAKTEGDEDERFSLSKWSGGKMSISRISSCLAFNFKRVLVFPTPTRLQYQIHSLKIGYSIIVFVVLEVETGTCLA